MREVVFKNMVSKKAKKREISVEEVVTENGCIARTIKRSLYFIRSTRHIESREELERWMKVKSQEPNPDKKDFHIMKIHSDKSKSDTVLCKAKGALYVVFGNEVFNIVFLHSLRMETSPQKKKKAV